MKSRGTWLLGGLLALWAWSPPDSVSSDSGKMCPPDEQDSDSPCGAMCASDDTCPSEELCCRYGCRRECRLPEDVNPGYCPWVSPAPSGRCRTNCTTDASCGRGKKCCRWGCFSTCVPAEPAHPGVCPARRVLRRAGPCRNTCEDDQECSRKQKCCFTGCSLECTDIH